MEGYCVNECSYFAKYDNLSSGIKSIVQYSSRKCYLVGRYLIKFIIKLNLPWKRLVYSKDEKWFIISLNGSQINNFLKGKKGWNLFVQWYKPKSFFKLWTMELYFGLMVSLIRWTLKKGFKTTSTTLIFFEIQ